MVAVDSSANEESVQNDTAFSASTRVSFFAHDQLVSCVFLPFKTVVSDSFLTSLKFITRLNVTFLFLFQDEHGQSMLHFAAARQHGRNALFQLLQETDINLGFRDELYRTARDVSIQAGMADNTKQVDRYIIFLAANGDTDKLVELLLEGYDHIIDIVDDEDVPILQVC